MTLDYVPAVDLERFPREDVYLPEPAQNPLNAWAWRCSIKDKSPSGILKGKTVTLKDNIAVKDVPMLMGTDVVKNYTPVSPPSHTLGDVELTRIEHRCDGCHTRLRGWRAHHWQSSLRESLPLSHE